MPVKLKCEWIIPRAEAEQEIREHGAILPKRQCGHLKTVAAQARAEFRICKWVCTGKVRAVQFSERRRPEYTAIVHPSTKPKQKGRWQVSYFDSHGAISDTVRDTCTEAVELLPSWMWRLRAVE